MRPGGVIAGRFELGHLAGSGGIGLVYRARDRRTGKAVALKLLKAPDPEVLERFARECKVLAELKDPGIVRYVDHGDADVGTRYLAMEWLDGEPLGSRLSRARLSVKESVVLGHRVAAALGAAHRNGIVHRDIKPNNLFLVDGRVEQVKILDFGLAAYPMANTLTVSGTTVGTPGYMAPEQVRGDPSSDARADVYSLGCVVFEALTGRRAFVGQNALALLAKILLSNPPRVRELRREVPEALDQLVWAMLSKDPAFRPASGDDLEALLRPLLSPASVRPPPIGGGGAVGGGAVLSDAEQRLLCAVLLNPSSGGGREGGESETSPPPTIDANRPHQFPGAPVYRLRQIVDDLGGQLESFADGTMVVTITGAQTAPDQAARAARSALAMRGAFPNARIAIATGRGQVGLDLPSGDVIDRAARLLAQTDPHAGGEARGGIYVDDVTAKLLEGQFELAAGRVNEMVAERDVVVANRALKGKAGPLIGRQAELACLEAFWDACVDERSARVVLLTGATGVGKSRLRGEFIERVRAKADAHVWVGAVDPLDARAPFALLTSLLRSAADVSAGEPTEVQRSKLYSTLRGWMNHADAARVMEVLGDVVDVPWARGGPRSSQATASSADVTCRAWEDALTAAVRTRPVLLVLEDLQWVDVPSVSAIDAALRTLRDERLLVLAIGRVDANEVFPALGAGRSMTELRLGELTRRASEQLVLAVAGDQLDAAAVERIVERGSGNVVYLGELVRASLEGKGHNLPETMLAMAHAELEGLAPEARRVLRAASVFGQVFWGGGLKALLAGSNELVLLGAWLGELVDRNLVTRRPRSRFPGEDEYEFRHALVRDAAYARLVEGDRTLGHSLAGDWLQRIGETQARTLAEHFERGGDWARASEACTLAARQALDSGDLEGALRMVERGVACGAEDSSLARLRLLAAEAYMWRGENIEAEASAREARELVEPGCAEWSSSQALLATVLTRLERAPELVDIGRQLRRQLTLTPSRKTLVVASATTALCLWEVGETSSAEQLEMCLVPHLSGRDDEREPMLCAVAHQRRASAAWRAWEPLAAMREMGAAVDQFERAGTPSLAALQRVHLAAVHNELGAYSEAEQAMREVLLAARRMGLTYLEAVAHLELGVALSVRGQHGESLAVLDRAVEAFWGQGHRLGEATSRLALTRMLIRSGELDEAESHARASLELLRSESPLVPVALATLARALLAHEHFGEAVTAARRGVVSLGSCRRARSGHGFVELTLAEALEAAGRHDEACATIRLALEHLSDDAARIEDATWRARFLEGVEEHTRIVALDAAWNER